jgi:hypothetical protein
MAKKYVNFRVGGSPQKINDDYSVWTNDLLGKVIASKTVIEPGRSTVGHRLVESDVVYINEKFILQSEIIFFLLVLASSSVNNPFSNRFFTSSSFASKLDVFFLLPLFCIDSAMLAGTGPQSFSSG